MQVGSMNRTDPLWKKGEIETILVRYETEDWTSGTDNKPIQVKGHGTLEITFVNKHGQPVDLDIHCFYAPNCTANLLSIGQIYNQTNDVTVAGPGQGRSDYFDGSGLHFLSTQQVQLESYFKGERNEVTSHLGMRVYYDRGAGTLTLDQEEFVKKILKHFAPNGALNDWKPVETPLEVGGELVESSESEPDFDQKLYQQANGSLAYLATRTRPDISMAWSVVSRRNAKPKQSDWIRLKRILRYLAGTKSMGLIYKHQKDLDWSDCLVGYCDASFGGSKVDRKSQSGFFFTMCNSPIIWCSKKQPIIALSTTEAEYICLAMGVKEGCWLVNILGEIGLAVAHMTVLEDNMGAIHIAQNSSSLGRVKHIDIRYHYIKQKVEEGSLSIKYCKTDNMVADVLTKGLAKVKFNYFRGLLGISRLPTL